MFSGHRIDEDSRVEPRFPAACELANRELITRAIEHHQLQHGPIVGAIAAAASGGDILFHEACHALGTPTRLYLPLEASEFVARSVAPSGGDWSTRFDALRRRCETVVMTDTPTVHNAPSSGPPPNVWQAGNNWMLDEAIALGAAATTLIALWDGAKATGNGGTADMVAAAEHRGVRVWVVQPATSAG